MINAATGTNDVEVLFQLEIPDETMTKPETLVKVENQEKVENPVEAKIPLRGMFLTRRSKIVQKRIAPGQKSLLKTVPTLNVLKNLKLTKKIQNPVNQHQPMKKTKTALIVLSEKNRPPLKPLNS